MPDISIYPGFTESPYLGSLWIASATGSNLPKRVLMANLMESRGVIGSSLYTPAWTFPTNFRLYTNGYFFIGPTYGSAPYFWLTVAGQITLRASDGALCSLQGAGVTAKGINTAAGYTFYLLNDYGAPTRRAAADSWNIYASSLESKSDVREITGATDMVQKIEPIAYSQMDMQTAGFFVENLAESVPLSLNKNEAGKIIGYNPNCILSTLVASVKELTARVQALESSEVQ